MDTIFTQSEEQSKGLFQLIADGKTVARMTYSRIDDHQIIVDHTATDPSLKGSGLGKKIVMEMVEWVRSHDHKVMPLCPFAKSVMESTPETHDVLRS